MRSKARLAELLAGVAEVRTVDALLREGLFGANVTEALTSRLANLVVLPAPGEAAYWLEPGVFEQRFLGQHGGLSDNEMAIPLVSWVAGAQQLARSRRSGGTTSSRTPAGAPSRQCLRRAPGRRRRAPPPAGRSRPPLPEDPDAPESSLRGRPFSGPASACRAAPVR